jgi:hypothetical protein
MTGIRDLHTQPPIIVGGQFVSHCANERQRALDFVDVVVDTMPYVEQRSGVVLGNRADARNAGHAKQQRERQGALVKRRKDDRFVKRAFAQCVNERVDVFSLQGLRIGFYPCCFANDRPRNAGQRLRCGGAAGPA